VDRPNSPANANLAAAPRVRDIRQQLNEKHMSPRRRRSSPGMVATAAPGQPATPPRLGAAAAGAGDVLVTPAGVVGMALSSFESRLERAQSTSPEHWLPAAMCAQRLGYVGDGGGPDEAAFLKAVRKFAKDRTAPESGPVPNSSLHRCKVGAHKQWMFFLAAGLRAGTPRRRASSTLCSRGGCCGGWSPLRRGSTRRARTQHARCTDAFSSTGWPTSGCGLGGACLIGASCTPGCWMSGPS